MAFIKDLFDPYKAQATPLVSQTDNTLLKNMDQAQNFSNQVNQGQMALYQALQGQNAIGNQNALVQQLQQQAQGGGPNPAADMLTAATDMNNRQNAGLVASQKGLNPALAARMAGQNSALANQQAANQASGMRANQQLAAQQMLGNTLGSQIGNLQGQGSALSNAGATQQQLAQGAINSTNQANLTNTGNLNQVNSNTSNQNVGLAGQLIGGLLGSGGQAAVRRYSGGEIPEQQPTQEMSPPALVPAPTQPAMSRGLSFLMGGSPMPMLNMGGQVQHYPTGGAVTTPELTKEKKVVPGKAKLKGDHPANDTVDAKLSPGEIVLPRSVVNSEDPIRASADFVAAVLAKKNHGKK